MATSHMEIAAEVVAKVDEWMGFDDTDRRMAHLVARQLVRRFEKEDAFRQRSFFWSPFALRRGR